MAKYIIDIASPNVRNEYIVYWTYDGLEAKRVSDLTPYTEPDLEQVRLEAEQLGMVRAWGAARKIANMPYNEEEKAFGSAGWAFIEKHTATEAIEKIRQYEQRQEELIQVGDEVENTQTGVKFIVTHLWKNNRCEQGVSGFNQECSAFSTTLSLVVKTGRHFPEIAAVLQKMKESDNG